MRLVDRFAFAQFLIPVAADDRVVSALISGGFQLQDKLLANTDFTSLLGSFTSFDCTFKQNIMGALSYFGRKQN